MNKLKGKGEKTGDGCASEIAATAAISGRCWCQIENIVNLWYFLKRLDGLI